MATDRQVQETVARCVATMVLYHNEKRSRPSTVRMTAEVRAVSAAVAGFGLGAAQAEQLVLRPVEAELSARYGPEAARKLHCEFVKAFSGSADPEPVLTPYKV